MLFPLATTPEPLKVSANQDLAMVSLRTKNQYSPYYAGASPTSHEMLVMANECGNRHPLEAQYAYIVWCWTVGTTECRLRARIRDSVLHCGSLSLASLDIQVRRLVKWSRLDAGSPFVGPPHMLVSRTLGYHGHILLAWIFEELSCVVLPGLWRPGQDYPLTGCI